MRRPFLAVALAVILAIILAAPLAAQAAGSTWTPVFEDQPSYSIGEITLDPTNPAEEAERIYALLSDGGQIFMKMEETFFASALRCFATGSENRALGFLD